MPKRCGGSCKLGAHSLVVEVGSNDGYLLRNFVAAGVPVLGIEPAQNVARAAEAAGVRTLPRFFGSDLAHQLKNEGRRADLIACNNTLAQIPDLNDFVAGLAELLAPDGLLTIEVPHLMRLLSENQFDTIYHEHFSYFRSGRSRPFSTGTYSVVDVEQLPTHGGSLRVHARHAAVATPGQRVAALLEVERREGLADIATYASFGDRVVRLKQSILQTLIQLQREGRTIAGYGAPARRTRS